MRHACKECGAAYRYPHDLDEHKRIGHVTSSNGPTWSDKDVEEETVEEPQGSPLDFNGSHVEFALPSSVETEALPE